MNDDQDASRNTLPPQADVAANVEAAADADNRVGYRRPPRDSRFQPGQSGNPRGRPRGVKSLSDIVRKIVGSDHRLVLPASALFGAAFLVVCDLVARTLFAPVEIPVGIVTALLGGPFFLWLLIRRS